MSVVDIIVNHAPDLIHNELLYNTDVLIDLYDGIDIVKEALKKAVETREENISIKYLGAGTYSFIVTAKDYKEAEKLLKEGLEKALDHIRINEGEGECVRVGE